MRNQISSALVASLLTLLVAMGATQIAASDNPPPQIEANGNLLLQEWFADIPWHQKLSSNDSNLIDIPFVLPFAAIPKTLPACSNANTETDQSRCMLEHGIVNVLAFDRTDTLYNLSSDHTPQGQDCADGKCVRVKIDVQRLNTQTNDSCAAWAEPGVPTTTACQPDIVTNDPVGGPPPKDAPESASYGFAISEATVFAPWRPWYMGHYCGYGVASVSDSVCYESYFTSQLQAYTPPGMIWPNDRAAFFFPRQNNQVGAEGPVVGNYCLPGEDKCTMYLAKVDWSKDGQGNYMFEPRVTGCELAKDVCDRWPLATLEEEVKAKTQRLDNNFEAALQLFTDTGRFPWGHSGIPSKSPKDADLPGSPYLGYYDLVLSEERPSDWQEKNAHNRFQAAGYVFPKECTKEDFAKARHGEVSSVEKLKDCALDYELHYSGFFKQWEPLFQEDATRMQVFDIMRDMLRGLEANQYGRTMFLMAGVPEQKIAAPFFTMDPSNQTYPSELSIYDQVYGASLYTQYLPMVNPADDNAEVMQHYGANMWHSFFMSNHMNQSPEHFIRGIRGRTLWHNEWRSNMMFLAYYTNNADAQKPFTQVADDRATGLLKPGIKFDDELAHRDFPGGFQPGEHIVPYHGNTCDSCHIRNGSGIPLAPNGFLSNIHTDRGLNSRFILIGDYTYSNGYNPRRHDPQGKGDTPSIPSMKMVLFDLNEPMPPRTSMVCDADDHTVPASSDLPAGGFYNNKIMNFYGNSFHVNLEGEFPDPRLPTYNLRYVEIGSSDDIGAGAPFEIVDKTERKRLLPNNEGTRTYKPMRAVVTGFQTGNRCVSGDIEPFPRYVKDEDWPSGCEDVNGASVEKAINVDQQVGYMHLLGKRLGNTPLIEMIPEKVIVEAVAAQKQSLGGFSGCYQLSPGTRAGLSLSDSNYRACRTKKLGTDGRPTDCYIGRWGWIGDRASLEDQVANAAHVEQNITTRESYNQIHPSPTSTAELVRYDDEMCGPADQHCELSAGGNSDLTEQEVRDMATYQRWIGIPQRSQFQVESTAVQEGEKLFRSDKLGCNNCHVIDKIVFDETDNMLPDEERAKLSKLRAQYEGKPDYPFVSYLGTDLLMHDMGYLSQVGKGPQGETMRDPNTGAISRKYLSYFQFIRTPPLKGLRFNRFVTNSNRNSTDLRPNDSPPLQWEAEAGCDFLLHDGRACDAIEAAYLHDGPAVKTLSMIENLNALSPEEMDNLRAFLYSL